MIIMVQKKKSLSGYAVPSGGTILWYGSAAALPSGWSIDQGMKGNYVEAAGASEATDVVSGSNSHAHSNPNTSTAPSHTHSHGTAGLANYNPTADEYSAPGQSTVAIPTHSHSITAGVTDSAGEHSHSVPNTLSESNHPPYARYYWIKATGDQPVPIGGIIIWDDAIANRPSGFNLCDGGTYNELVSPDLRDKFIYSADDDVNVGDTGGSETHTHTMQGVTAAGGHSHSISGTTTGSASKDGGYAGVDVQSVHSHGWTATTTIDSDHTHTFSSPTGSANHLPPYIQLYFIIRTV